MRAFKSWGYKGVLLEEPIQRIVARKGLVQGKFKNRLWRRIFLYMYCIDALQVKEHGEIYEQGNIVGRIVGEGPVNYRLMDYNDGA